MPTMEQLLAMTTDEKGKVLITASKNGDIETINLLLELHLNIRANHDEAMREAAYHGQLAVVELLVANGADIHAKNEEALAFAVRCNPNRGHIEVVKYLLEKNADIELSKINHPSEWSSIIDKTMRTYLTSIGIIIV